MLVSTYADFVLGMYREEVFGPVLVVVKYHTDAEAVALANDCPFGLGSTVFSGSKTRANAIAQQLQVPYLIVALSA